jgi:ribose transport system ATP-binding protein
MSAMVEAGVGYVPRDRKAEGLLLYQSLPMNISLPSIGTDRVTDPLYGIGSALGLIDHDKEVAMAEDAVAEVDVRTADIEALVHQLSGGNQQKVVLGKWLAREADILVLDNVSRGIDVAAKEEVYRVCRDLVDRDVSLVFVGDELPEVIGMSNRIGVMKKGRLVDVVEAPPDDKPTESDLITKMI